MHFKLFGASNSILKRQLKTTHTHTRSRSLCNNCRLTALYIKVLHIHNVPYCACKIFKMVNFYKPQTCDMLNGSKYELAAAMPSQFNDMCMVKRSLRVPSLGRDLTVRHDGKQKCVTLTLAIGRIYSTCRGRHIMQYSQRDPIILARCVCVRCRTRK